MKSEIRASVAMAVCNGELFLKEQMESIRMQLGTDDELIISYDPSEDHTLQIIKQYEKCDSRIHVYVNTVHEKGLVGNFENALRHCSGKYICYADQDDIWLPGKIERMCAELEKADVMVVIHDASLVDKEKKEIAASCFKIRGGNTGWFRNLIRLSYIGCCMAFRAEMLPVILPVPLAHDWWTGTVCSLYGRMKMVKQKYVLHRIHETNATAALKMNIYRHVRIRLCIFTTAVYRRIKYRKKALLYSYR